MHLMVLAMTGVLMGCLTTFVGLPGITEPAAWLAAYVAWVLYGVHFRMDTPLRTMGVASTLSGLFASSIQVLFMEAYRQSNPWYAEYFQGEAKTIAIQFFGQGIGAGLVFGLVTGVITGQIIKRRQG
jgi:hypothetical protein